MTSHKVQVKVFVSGQANSADYVPVFQRWIRDQVLDELLIDVVDYSHVVDGPQIALIGHVSNYVLDRSKGKLGLLYANKRSVSDSINPFEDALRRTIRVCRLLQSETGAAPALAFDTKQLEVRIADRLFAPNTDETLDRIAPAIREGFATVYGEAPLTLERVGSPRELFAVRVEATKTGPLRDLAV